MKRFGSGWTWLVWDGTGLAVYSTANQDSPIMQSDVPLLGIDVWEHAYYLHYQNRRPDYLGAWWDVVNWDEVGRRYEEARRLGRYFWRQLRTGEIAPRSPAPAAFTDIASRRWLSPFGQLHDDARARPAVQLHLHERDPLPGRGVQPLELDIAAGEPVPAVGVDDPAAVVAQREPRLHLHRRRSGERALPRRLVRREDRRARRRT